MLGWVIMAAILLCALGYFFYSVSLLSRSTRTNDLASFAQVRAKEIDEEIALGRINHIEAAQLRRDLVSEETIQQKQQQTFYRQDSQQIRIVLAIVLVVVVLGSTSIYQRLGFAREVTFTQLINEDGMTPDKLTQFLQFRADKYSRVEDWYYVAQDHLGRNEVSQALMAFDKAVTLMPVDMENRLDVLVEYAETIFYANDSKVSDKLQQIVEQILVLAPEQATALGLKGVIAFEQQDYLTALLSWQKAVLVGRNYDERMALLAGIEKARQMGAISEDRVPSVINKRLRIRLAIDALTQLPANSLLLVYAKSTLQPMPVAIKRVAVDQLQGIVELTNLDNLMPGMTLSEMTEVDIVVRLAKEGDADLTQGKIVGRLNGVDANERQLLTIKVAL